MIESKNLVVNYDPWKKLAQTAPLKDVPLNELLKRLELSDKEASTVKRQLISRVNQLTPTKE